MKISHNICFIVLVGVLLWGCGADEGQYSTKSPEAIRIYEEGVQQLRLFHYMEARASFEEAIGLDSAFALAWARMAILDFTAQNEAKAREEISRALVLSSNATRKEQLFVRMWERRINFSRDEAEAIVDSLITLHPRDPEAYVFRGMLYEEKKHLDESIRMYKRALEIDTAFAPAAMMLGYAYSTANDQERALAAMERYIRLAPHAADPRASYADLLLRVGRYDEALEQYKHSLDLKPDYWYAFQQIGTIYAIRGRLHDAELNLTKGFQLLPSSASLEASHISSKAGFQLQRGRYTEALRMYAEAIGMDSTNLSASYGYVHALTKLGRLKEAAEMLGQIVQELSRRGLLESQAMVGMHLTRSRILIEEGKLDEALGECDEAFQYSSPLNRPAIHRNRADVLMKLGLFEDALGACEEALSVNPNAPQVLLTLTRVYAAKGDARMTREIGNRLHALWNEADPDFQDAKELKRLLNGRKGSGV